VKFTLRDLVWAVLIGVLIAISPQSSSKTSVSVLCGVLTIPAVLYYRRRYPRPADRPPLFSRAPMLLWAIVVTYLLLYSSVFFWLGEQYTHGIWWNGHSLFVPLLMVALTDRILRSDVAQAQGTGATAADSSAWGLPLIAAGVACVVVDCGIRSQYLSLFGLLLCLPGFSLLLLGPRRTRLLWLPLTLSLFLIPISTRVVEDLYLPQLISRGIVATADLFGLPAVRVETTVSIAAGGFNVSEDCSGFGGVYASLCVALVLAAYSRSRGRIALLFTAPWLLAIAINIPRGFVLLLGVKFLGMDFLTSIWHTASGIVACWIALAAMLWLADWRTLREQLA